MIQGCRTVRPRTSQVFSIRVDGNRSQIQHCPATDFATQARKVERQSIADINAGVQSVRLVKLKCLAHSRLKIKLPAQQAAAKAAGHDDPIAQPAAAAKQGTL